MNPSPLIRYRALLEDCSFTPDAEQEIAVRALDDLWHELLEAPRPSIAKLVRRRRPAPVRGLYLWGSVGRGKTWLMDLFYDCLPSGKKTRIHFHRFMQRVHQALRKAGNVRDPLPAIARDWASSARVLCLDEFFVSDIADAMLLSGLLTALFDHGVTLVTTSNMKPETLYRDGLQRAKFLPAIELLNEKTRVLELGGSMDFRLRILERSEIFHQPLDAGADAAMTVAFERLAADCEMNHDLEINGRNFHAQRRGDGVIWFDFDELCSKPRGAVDYIEIARSFYAVVITNVPVMDELNTDGARRFITLVDEFYDRNVKLLLSAAAPLDALYTGRRLEFEFERTQSRLVEMQSHDYLAKPHLP